MRLKRDNFSGLLHKVLKNTLKPEMLKNGFRACGLLPLDPDALDYFKMKTKEENVQVSKNVKGIKSHLTYIGIKLTEALVEKIQRLHWKQKKTMKYFTICILIYLLPENEAVDFVVEEGILQKITNKGMVLINTSLLSILGNK